MNDCLPPLVSVIIATYNRANVLARAIRSVLHQSYQNFEILIVDDKSTDNTQQIVVQFTDKRIRFLRHEVNQGQSASHNTGINHAHGVYVAFLDSDDEWLPSMLEECLNKFMQDEGIGVVYTWAGTHNRDGSLVPVNRFRIQGEIYKEALTQGYVSHSITMVIKRDCFKKVGSWDVDFTVCADDDICLRLAKFYRFELLPEVLAVIHQDGGNKVTQNSKANALGWWKLFLKYENEIMIVCGNKTMAEHLSKCGRLFLVAYERECALNAYLRAWALHQHPRYLAAICLLKSKIVFKLVPLLLTIIKRIRHLYCF
ncbi:glycosyltransferase family 2 protein [Thermodesulfobacteriota bacterium]